MTESDIKDVVRLTVKEVITQPNIDSENVDYLLGMMNEIIKTTKGNEGSENKRIVLEKVVKNAMFKVDYDSGMKYKELSDKYGMTLDGVYKKVKAMGIYKPRRQEKLLDDKMN